jgi:hypothetical protein
MSQVATSSSSGGLVLSWRPRVDLECFAFNKNNILAWCYSDPLNRRDILAFWDTFASIGEGFEASWLYIGRFLFSYGSI